MPVLRIKNKSSYVRITGKSNTLRVVNSSSVAVRKTSKLARISHGPTGPPGSPGIGGASRTTLLTITQQSPSGTSFFVNSGGTHYTFDLEAGDLGLSETMYLENEAIQIYLRGTKLLKNKHTQWVSQFSFVLKMPVDIGDYLEILS